MSEFASGYSPQFLFQGPSNEWLPLMEYAVQKGVSLSTLRRYIKAQKVEYKLEKGRYFIRNSAILEPHKIDSSKEGIAGLTALQEKNRLLESELHKAYEEISELKMLVDLYENKIPESHPTLDQ